MIFKHEKANVYQLKSKETKAKKKKKKITNEKVPLLFDQCNIIHVKFFTMIYK